MTRQAIHEELDRILDGWGIKETIPPLYNTIRIEYIQQDGKPHIVVAERTTLKPMRVTNG